MTKQKQPRPEMTDAEKEDLYGKEIKHPAFGNIQISRVSGSKKLHDSPLHHHHMIALRISTETVNRHLNQNWHHEDAQIVEVYMSEAQFAQAICSMNTSGTPCTLTYYRDPKTGEVIQPSLDRTNSGAERETFDEEIQKKIDEVAERVSAVEAELDTVLSHKAIPKAVREAAKEVAKKIAFLLNDLPFIQDQFVRAMDKTENAAKTEVVALANRLVYEKGLEALGVTRQMLLDDKDAVIDTEAKQLPPGSPEKDK